MDNLYREAVISDDQRYRYALYREFKEHILDSCRVLNFVMLNPSTADAQKEDPTIRKCMGFAKENGFNAVRVVNLFAFRATDPKDLERAYKAGVDVVGPENNAYVGELPPEETVVAAWGSTFKDKPFLRDRVNKTIRLLNRPLRCLRKTADGNPWHPLYVPYGAFLDF